MGRRRRGKASRGGGGDDLTTGLVAFSFSFKVVNNGARPRMRWRQVAGVFSDGDDRSAEDRRSETAAR